MFNNVGSKIKGAAVATFYLTTISSIITGIWLSFHFEDLSFLLIAISGVISALVLAWIIYAYGQNAENLEIIKKAVTLQYAPKEERDEFEKAQKESFERSKAEAEALANKKAEMRAKRYEAAGINIPKEDPKEKPKTARHSFVQCPECKKELVYPHDATVGVCSRCSAPFSINENGTEYLHLSPIKQPESIPNFNKWIAEIEALTNEELLKRYLEEDEWQEEYRYLCYTELMSRLNIN